MTSKTILLTGASGLLGRAIRQCFKQDPQWNIVGLGFTRLAGGLKKVDITNDDEVKNMISTTKPALIIHSAAERRPDVVETQEDATHRLNVQATRSICTHAASIQAPVLFISTDYVFDGKKPPYNEGDETNPLNKYGKSKLEGEKVVLEASKDNLVLRVALLYGQVETIVESAVTILFPKVKDSSTPCKMSAYERRFPTHVEDVAEALKILVTKRLEDPSLCGIFHWSGEEMMTKYDMAVAMAEVFNLPANHIEADATPSSGATRPYDAHLASGRLEALGASKRTPFREGIKPCLQPYL